MMLVDNRKLQTLQAIHIDTVNKAVNYQENNIVLDDLPHPIDDSEKNLTRKDCAVLAQLRSGNCRLLGFYKSRITVDIYNNLKWHAHIGYIKNKISKYIGIIYKARKYINKQNLINLYYSFIFPYLIYCNEIWGNACQNYLDPLIKLQKNNTYHDLFFI